jgi:hypothetical protein
MSLRKLKLDYPEIFTEEKYPEQDAGDPGVSMEYYIDEIIGLDGYTYDDYLGKHKLTLEEERKLINIGPEEIDSLREKGWIK